MLATQPATVTRTPIFHFATAAATGTRIPLYQQVTGTPPTKTPPNVQAGAAQAAGNPWSATFDFTQSQAWWKFLPRGGEQRAVYQYNADPKGWIAGSNSVLIQLISEPFPVDPANPTYITRVEMTLSAPFETNGYIQVAETADNATYNQSGGGLTTVGVDIPGIAMNSLFVGAVFPAYGSAIQHITVSGTGANPFAGTPPPTPVTWQRAFDFRQSQAGFEVFARSTSDVRAVYTAGVGFTHGYYSNVIQIDYPAFARTTLTQVVVTLSEPVISGEYLQVCETGDSAVCYNGGGSGTTLSRYILPQASMTSIFIGVVNGPSTVALQSVTISGVDGDPFPPPTPTPTATCASGAAGRGMIADDVCAPPDTPTPTPTAFPTPTQSACIFHVSNPGVPGIGLAVRESPTKNSPRLDTIPWTYTQPLIAIYRIDIGSDRWYQVSDYHGYSAWIGAIVGTDTYVDNPNCTLPTPYPANWPTIAQVESAEIPTGCDIDAYLRTEPGELVLARVTFGEVATYNTSATVTPGDTSGGIVFTDALRVSWIIRMDAFMGLPNYGPQHSVAGRSVSITDMILTQRQYAPITDLRSALQTNGCNPSGIETSQANVKRMVYPTNAQDRAELYQLWRIYQNIVISIINAQWSTMPSDIKGYEQFKGTAKAEPCPTGADNLSRPGPGLQWAANQPYPPKTVHGFTDSRFGADQLTKTCYQDAYHLDDLFWAALISSRPDLPQQPANTSSNIFPKEFCVAVLENPDNQADVYPLAQLTGILNASPWPPGPCTIH